MIKLLNPDHVKTYRNLRLHSLKTDPEVYLSTYESEKEKSNNYFLSRLLYATQSPIFGYYGYFKDDTLVGYVQLSKSSLDKKQHIAYIYELYVHPEYRRKKIATRIINKTIEKAASIPHLDYIELYVNSDNERSIKLYERLGFKKVATIPNAVKEKNEKYQDELIFIYHL